MDVEKYVHEIGEKTKEAAYTLATLPSSEKNLILNTIADKIEKKREFIKEENTKDMNAGRKKNLSTALLDRLLLTDQRIDGMLESLRTVAKLDDPVGEVYEQKKMPNGLLIGKQRIPLGVIGIIFESRPNVTIEAASLCIKSGNGVILRGGSEAIHSNKALGKIIKDGIKEAGFNEDMVGIIEITDREAVLHMLKAKGFIDIIIPRGGDSLIEFVTENSILPVVKHDKGVCSLFVNHDARKEMAESIAVNAKVQRPGVCNAIENLYIHREYPYKKELVEVLARDGVEIRAYQEAHELFPEAKKITDLSEFDVEYLDFIISIKIVDSIEEAIDMIERHGSGHSDAIVTESYFDAVKFLNRVNSAAVYVNASTRFTDGFEFGLGAEIGISTNKLHARGPMGLREMTTYKYVIMGEGQIRK